MRPMSRVESHSFQDNTPDASDTNTVHQTSSTHGDTLETNVEQSSPVTAVEDQLTCTARVESPSFQDNTPDASDTNTVHQTSSTEGDTLETNVEQSSPVTAVEDQVTFPDIVESPSFQDNTPDASDTNTVHHTSRKDFDTLETNVEQSSPVTAVEKQVTFPDIVESPSFQDNTQGTSDTNTVHQTSSTDGDTLETNVEQSSPVTAVEDKLTCTASVESPSFQDNTTDASDTNTVHQTSSTDGDTLETNVEQSSPVTDVEDQLTCTARVESPSFQDNTPDASDTNTVHQTSSTEGDTLETNVEQSSPVTAVEEQVTFPDIVESPSFQDNTQGTSDTNTVHQTSSTDGDTLETNVEQSSPVTAVEDQLTCTASVESPSFQDNTTDASDINTVHQTSSTDGDTLETNVEQSSSVTAVEDQLTCTARVESPSFQDNTPDASDTNTVHQTSSTDVTAVEDQLTCTARVESPSFQDNTPDASDTNTVHQTSSTDGDTLKTNLEQSSTVKAVEDQLTSRVESPSFQDNTPDASDTNTVHQTSSTDGDTLETNVEQSSPVTAVEDQLTCTARIESPSFQDNTPDASDTNTVHQTSRTEGDTLETNVEQSSPVTAVEDQVTFPDIVESPSFQDNTPDASDTNTVHHTSRKDFDTLETNVEQSSPVTAVEKQVTFPDIVESPSFQDNTQGTSDTNTVHQTSSTDGDTLETNVEQSSPVTAVEDKLTCTASVESPSFQDNTTDASDTNTVHQTSSTDGDTLETNVEQSSPVTAVEDQLTCTARVESPSFQDNTPDASDTNTVHQTSSTEGDTLETNVEQSSPVTAVEEQVTFPDIVESPSFQDNTQGTSDTNTVHQTSSTDGDTLETNVEQSSPVTAVEDQLTCTASVESPSFQDNTTDASDINTVHQTSSTDGDTLETNVEQSSSVTAVEDQLTCTARVESPSFQDNTPDASDTNTVHQTSSTDVTAVEDQLTCTARVESPSFQDNTPDASDTNTVHQTSSTDGDTLKTNLEQSSTVKAVEDQLTCTARVESPSFQDNTPDASDTNTVHQTSSTHDNTPDASDTNTVHQTSSTDGDTLETNVEQSSPVTAVEDQLTCTARVESPSFQDNTPDASDTNTVHQTSRTEGDTLETNVEQASPVTAVEEQVTFPDIVESPSFQDNTPDASDTNTVHHTSRKDVDTLETNVEQSSPVTPLKSNTDGDTLETNVEQSSPVTAVEDQLTCTASVESPSFQDNTTDASDTNTVHQTSSTDGDTLETNVEQSSSVTAVEDQLTCTARVESPSFQDNTPDASDTNTVHQTSSTDVTAVEDQLTCTARVESPSFQDNTPDASDTNTVHQTSSTDVTAVEDQLTCTARVESPSFQDNTPDASDTNTVHQTSSTDGDTLKTNLEQSSTVKAVEDQLTSRVESPSFQDNTPDASDTNTVHQTSSTDGDTLETNVEQSSPVTAVEDQLTCTARIESPSFQDNTPDASDTNTVHQTSRTEGDTLETNVEQSSPVTAVEDQVTFPDIVESPSFQDNTPDASDTNTVHHTSRKDFDTLETNVEQSSPVTAVEKQVTFPDIVESPSFQDNTQGTSDTNTVHQTSSTDGDTLETNVEQSSPVTAVEDKLTCTASVESPSFQDNTTDASDTNTVHQTSSTDGDTLETNVEQSSPVTAVEDQLTCTARVESPSFQDNTPDASDTNTVHQTSSTEGDTLETNVEQSSPVTAVEEQVTFPDIVESPSFQDNTQGTSDTNTVHQTSSTDGDTLETNVEQSSPVTAVEDQLTCTASVESPSFQDNTTDASDINTVHQTSSTDGDTLETNVEQSSSVTAVEDQLTCTARVESPSFQDNTPDASDTNTVHQTSSTDVTAVEDQLTCTARVESPSFQDNTPDASDTNTVHQTSSTDGDTLKTNLEQSSTVKAVEDQLTCTARVESPSFQDNTPDASDTNTVHQTSSTHDNTPDASDTNTVHQTSSTDGDTLETNVEQSSPVTAVEDQLTCTARVESPSFQDNTPDASDTNTVHQTSRTEGDTLETNVEQASPVTAVEEQVTFPDIVESPSFQDNTPDASDTNTVHHTSRKDVDTLETNVEQSSPVTPLKSNTDGDTLETNVEQSSPVTAVEDQLTCTASVESPSFQDNTTDASDTNTVHQTSSTDGDTLETNVEQSSSVTAVEDQLTCTARVESPSFQDNTPDASDTNTVHQTSSTDVTAVEDQLTCTARVESPSFQDNTPDASDTNTVHQTSSTDGDTLKTNLEQSSTVKAVEDQLTSRVESPSFQDNTPDASDTNTVHQTSSTEGDTLETNVEQSSPVTAVEDQVTFPDIVESPSFQDNTPDASDTNTVHHTSRKDVDTLETNVEQSSPVTAVEKQVTFPDIVESPSFQDNTQGTSDTNTVHQTSSTDGDTLETNVEQSSSVTAVEDQLTCTARVESPSFRDNTPDASDTNTVHQTSSTDGDTLETNVELFFSVTAVKDQVTFPGIVESPSFQDNTTDAFDTNTIHQTSSTDGDTLETIVEQSSPVTDVEDQLTCTARVESPSFQDNTPDASDTNTVHQTSSTDGDTLETNVEQSSPVTAVDDQVTFPDIVESLFWEDNADPCTDDRVDSSSCDDGFETVDFLMLQQLKEVFVFQEKYEKLLEANREPAVTYTSKDVPAVPEQVQVTCKELPVEPHSSSEESAYMEAKIDGWI
ncbi:mucin-4-like [Mya arenaria]|uniref:mucin-4-like n=1 Tax=Mya arenaria TaxID=6604 RepID=UPI0022E89E5C|nr:mucin-4-like [Mya arenaria]